MRTLSGRRNVPPTPSLFRAAGSRFIDAGIIGPPRGRSPRGGDRREALRSPPRAYVVTLAHPARSNRDRCGRGTRVCPFQVITVLGSPSRPCASAFLLATWQPAYVTNFV
jgi:hypothetical protein